MPRQIMCHVYRYTEADIADVAGVSIDQVMEDIARGVLENPKNLRKVAEYIARMRMKNALKDDRWTP